MSGKDLSSPAMETHSKILDDMLALSERLLEIVAEMQVRADKIREQLRTQS